MSSTFAGVSVLAGGELCPSTQSSVFTSTNCGYHLLVVQDYSRTKRATPTGVSISSRPFMVGRHEWCIDYYPNCHNKGCDDFISLYVNLLDDDGGVGDAEEPVKAKFDFSFIDEAEKHKPMYISGTKTFGFRSECLRDYGKFMRKDALEQSANLMDDCFTIRRDIMICDTEDVGGNKVLLSEVDQDLNNLLETKVGADVTFEVSGEMFSAHRCVLAARSEVFMAQFFGPMKEGSTKSTVVQIEDMEAKVFRALLSFIYTDSIPVLEEEVMEEDQPETVEGQEEEAAEDVQWLQDLVVAADRYDLQRLKFICEKQLSQSQCTAVSSVASTLALAEQRHCRALKEACLKFIQVQSPLCLQKVMASVGWEPLITTYPSVLNELIAKLASN
ncbi:TD and POZ domain-containing protein 2 [Hordeum vulgare]|uniref:BTB domain-containing protein n=1 Tax=Hordeum vulgare subsp. vulgare TaxID=112509 RepID=A0A8I6WU44_HORVV|nr:BTB/POZ and MATH domain-containing protein 1-like [Hordeum vulgare subsp. vulgare]KAE8787073.1 TD and POZ domain-containing protein 2 [Hordeum vulgare]